MLQEIDIGVESAEPLVGQQQSIATSSSEKLSYFVKIRSRVTLLWEQIRSSKNIRCTADWQQTKLEIKNRCTRLCANKRSQLPKPIFLIVFIISLVVFQICYSVSVFHRFSKDIQSSSNTTTNYRQTNPSYENNIDYDEIYSSGGEHASYRDKRIFDFKVFENYTSPDIVSNTCSLTVVLVEPRLPPQGYNHPVWFTLESVASYVPYACVVIHTASCQIYKQTSNLPLAERLHQIEVTARAIYERSLPLFRRMMERGQVRISILEKGRYNIVNCGSWDISTLTMNIHFWKEEFFDGIDSDSILFLQDDAVLCRYLDIDPWKNFAYVGGPWQQGVFPGGCEGMRNIWRGWASSCSLTNPDLNIPQLCTPGHGGLVGNGGLSLRSRQWMIQVIETCPTEHSGLESYAHFGNPNEDVYFTTILNGIHAPMPTAFEASLLFVESIFPEQTFEQFFSLTSVEIEETVRRLWGNDTGMLIYDRMHDVGTYLTESELNNTSSENLPVLYTIPVGIHKPWDYHSQELLGGVQLKQECKFLKFMYNILI